MRWSLGAVAAAAGFIAHGGAFAHHSLFRVTVTDATTFTAPAVIEGKWLARGDTIARYDCHPAPAR